MFRQRSISSCMSKQSKKIVVSVYLQCILYTVHELHCKCIVVSTLETQIIDLFRQTASKFRYFCSQTCEFSRTKFWSMFSSEREIKAPSILLWLEIEWMIVVMGDFECVPMCHFGGLSLHIVFNATEFKNCHVHRIIPLHRYCAGDVTALIHQQQHLKNSMINYLP